MSLRPEEGNILISYFRIEYESVNVYFDIFSNYIVYCELS